MNGIIIGDRVVILSACKIDISLKQLLRPTDFIIACDAGYRNAELLGCKPNLVVGDFDSAPDPHFPDTIVLPHIKDDTDTQFAATWAANHGAKKILMLGALGGRRIEHTISNLSTGLYLSKRGVQTELECEMSRVQYLMPDKPLLIHRQEWKYFSIFPMEGKLEGVDIRGAYYPLKNSSLCIDYPLGVSNEFLDESVKISCNHGVGVVITTRDDS